MAKTNKFADSLRASVMAAVSAPDVKARMEEAQAPITDEPPAVETTSAQLASGELIDAPGLGASAQVSLVGVETVPHHEAEGVKTRLVPLAMPDMPKPTQDEGAQAREGLAAMFPQTPEQEAAGTALVASGQPTQAGWDGKPRGPVQRTRKPSAMSSKATSEPTVTTAPTDTTDATHSVGTEPTAPTENVSTDTTEPTDTTACIFGELTTGSNRSELTDTTSGENPLLCLAPSRLVFLRHVLANRARFDREFTPWSRVVQDTGLSLIGVKRITQDLSKRGIIRVEFDQLRRRGNRVYVLQEFVQALNALDRLQGYSEPTRQQSRRELTDTTHYTQSDTTDTTDMTEPTPLQRDRKEEVFLSEDAAGERLLALGDDQARLHWPNLYAVGFGADQIHQVVESLRAVGKMTSRLVEALDHADFELQERQGSLLDGQGRVVGKPAGYVFNALCRAGYYRRPEGYVSAAEQAERDAAEEARKVEAARKEREDLEFKAWLGGLTPEERQGILQQGFAGPEEYKLKAEWRKRQAAR